MCFNKANHERSQRQLEKRYEVEDRPSEKLFTYYHESGFQHLECPVITTEAPHRFSFFTWGLIPNWVQKLHDGLDFRNKTLNAISEEVFEKRSYKDCIHTQRCLIPVTGFYEYMDVKGKKYPHFIKLKSNEFFSLAGIYNHWQDNDSGKTYSTYSILTCAANPLMESIHNIKKRMPVIIPVSMEKDWIRTDLSPADIKSFFMPYPEDDMEAYSVSKLISSHTENTNVPEVMKPFYYPELNNQGSLF